MIRRRMKYWLIAVLLLSPIAASAEVNPDVSSPIALTPDGKNELSISLGGFQPTAKFGFLGVAGDKRERFGATGFAFAIDYVRKVNRFFGVGLEYAYLHRGDYTTSNISIPTGWTTKVRGDSNLLMALGRLQSPGTGWRPYLIGGAGVHSTRMDLLATGDLSFTPFSARGESAIVKGTATGFALMSRVGLQHVYNNGGFVGFDAGYYYLQGRSYPTTIAGAAAGYQNVSARGDGITYSVKFGIRYGANGS